MSWLERRSWIVGVAGAAALGVVVVAGLRGGHAAPSARAIPADVTPPPPVLVVVSGAVVHPGIYRLSASARVADAIAMAGGVTETADTSRIPNLAARVRDGHQIAVPARRSGSTGRAGSRLDLNTASVDELSALQGMPAGLPEQIVEYRNLWGPFPSVSEIRAAFGLDAATYSMLSRQLRVTSASSG